MFTRRLFIAASVVLCSLFSLSATAQGADTLRLSANYSNGVSVTGDTIFALQHKVILPQTISVDTSIGSYTLRLRYLRNDFDTASVDYFVNTGSNLAARSITDTITTVYTHYLGLSVVNANIQTVAKTIIDLQTEPLDAEVLMCVNLETPCELVCNGGFNENTACPIAYGQIEFAKYWKIRSNTPDYFNTCGSNTVVGIPNNVAGTQTTADGDNAYAGLLYHDGLAESMVQKTNTPLLAGRKYVASFKASWADKSVWVHNNLTMWVKSDLEDNTVLKLQTSQAIVDNENWTMLRQEFTSENGAENISIHLGFDGDDFAYNPPNGIVPPDFINDVYYYIDDVHLTLVPENLSNAPITKICGTSEPIIIGQSECGTKLPNNMTVQWTKTVNGQTSNLSFNTLAISVNPVETTTYTRTVTVSGYVYTSSATVNVVENGSNPALPLTITGSNILCSSSTLLTVTNPQGNTWSQYEWTFTNTNNVVQVITTNSNTLLATAPGTYTVKSLVGCAATSNVHTITVTPLMSVISIFNETTEQTYTANEEILICPDNVLKLSVSSNTNAMPISYAWTINDGGAANPTLQSPNQVNATLSFTAFTGDYANATIGIEVHDANGCTAYTQRSIRILSQCCVSGAVLLGKPNTTVAYTDNLPNSLNNKYLVVGNITLKSSVAHGTFVLNNSDIFVKGVTAYGSNQALGGTVYGPRINVEATSNLSVRGTSFQAACGEMWDGLYLDKASTLLFGAKPATEDEKRCFFADSRNGIVSDISSENVITLSNADFRNNFISLQTNSQTNRIIECTFTSDYKEMKKPFDFTRNSAINPLGYFYAHSFIRLNGTYAKLISCYGNTFNGAMYGIEFLGVNNSLDNSTSFIGNSGIAVGNAFSNFFVAGILGINENAQSAHTIRPYGNTFAFVGYTGANTVQMANAKAQNNMPADAMYGMHTRRFRISMVNGLNTFNSPSNVSVSTTGTVPVWQHKYNHIGIYAENAPSVAIHSSSGGNAQVFTRMKTAIQLEGAEGNSYAIHRNRFTNCQTGIHINRAASDVLNLSFTCNEFLKTWVTDGKTASTPFYTFTGVLLQGSSQIKAIAPVGTTYQTIINQLGNCDFNENPAPNDPPVRTTTVSPQGNEVKRIDENTLIEKPLPKNFTFINNQRVNSNNESLPLTYIRFGNENVWLVDNFGVTFDECESSNGGSIQATTNACNGTNGVLNRQGLEDDKPTALNRKVTLYQNYPNPFGQSTVIRYALPETMEMPSDLQLVVMEPISGKTLRSIAVAAMAGSIELSTEGLASGVYLYALSSQGSILATKKMVLNK